MKGYKKTKMLNMSKTNVGRVVKRNVNLVANHVDLDVAVPDANVVNLVI